MIASLPMYDAPATIGANDRLWGLIRDALQATGIAAPSALTRSGDIWDHWINPELVFSQTCGLPYRSKLHDQVALVGAPDYGLPHAEPGYYYSVFVMRRGSETDLPEDWADLKFAFNQDHSQSGWAAPITHLADQNVTLTNTYFSGGHRNSAADVAFGKADIASLDAVTWNMIQAENGIATQLTTVGRTAATPAMPYITAKSNDAARIRQAVGAALDQLAVEDQKILNLWGIADISMDQFLDVPTPAMLQTD
ncbi:phosphate/phosphite/phosphonate ABC transporter substrate-binding protein [Aestuariibius sp. HNIBRBA575]|uniref:phosphate/phosphite/phosphonate ABC transporter substrate-binding protein n=1 Tax=Aestuariibius sp. HNIBRBA575 TaxID=3233343 RepID=UPI0034A2D926